MQPVKKPDHEQRVQLKVQEGSGAVTVGLESLKLLFVLNGAGAVALLGFLASEQVKGKSILVEVLANSLVLMSIGAALAPIALGLAFVGIHAQYSAVSAHNRGLQPWLWPWKLALICALAAGSASVVLFVTAIWSLKDPIVFQL